MTRLLPYGERGLLVELEGLDAVLALAGTLRSRPVPGVLDVVTAARTVLLSWTDGTSPEAVAAAVRAALDAPVAVDAAAGRAHVLDVVYDGADLAEVAALTGLTPDEVMAAHTGTPWRVAFTGFAPGFGYLAGGDPRLVVPRRSSPRERVPAGAVGLAGELSGVYPRASPGGWQLIGTCSAALWDPDAEPPALLAPGDTVTFRAVP